MGHSKLVRFGSTYTDDDGEFCMCGLEQMTDEQLNYSIQMTAQLLASLLHIGNLQKEIATNTLQTLYIKSYGMWNTQAHSS